MPSIWSVIKLSFRYGYDYLGTVVAGSLGWFVLTALPLLLGPARGKNPGSVVLLITGLVMVLLSAPAAAGVFVAARKIVRRDDVLPADLLSGFTRLLLPSWGLAFADLFIAIVLAADLIFFSALMRQAAGVLRLLYLAMLVVTFYVGILWLLSTLYHWPLLAEQGGGIFKIQKRAALLVLDNPIFTIALALVIMLLIALLVASWAGVPVLLMGLVSILESQALLELFRRYGISGEEEEEIPPVSGEGGDLSDWEA